MLTRARRLRFASAIAPGVSTPSRTAAPTMVSNPQRRTIPAVPRITAKRLEKPRRCSGYAVIGTNAAPFPSVPSTATEMLYEPLVMIHS
jgi:hypothetical protein